MWIVIKFDRDMSAFREVHGPFYSRESADHYAKAWEGLKMAPRLHKAVVVPMVEKQKDILLGMQLP